MLFTGAAHALNRFIGECSSPLTFPSGKSVEALPLGRHPPFPGFYGAPASEKAVASPERTRAAAHPESYRGSDLRTAVCTLVSHVRKPLRSYTFVMFDR